MGFGISRIAPIVFPIVLCKRCGPGLDSESGIRSLRNLEPVCVGPVPALQGTNLRLVLIVAESHLDCRAAVSGEWNRGFACYVEASVYRTLMKRSAVRKRYSPYGLMRFRRCSEISRGAGGTGLPRPYREVP